MNKNINFNSKKTLKENLFGIDKYKPRKKTANDLIIITTSGSTGGSPTTIIRNSKFNKKLTDFYQFSKPVLIITYHNCHKLILAQILSDSKIKCPHFLIIDKDDFEDLSISSLIKELDPKIIYSFVSLFRFFIEEFSKKNKLTFNQGIEKIYLTGEKISESTFEYTKKMFPNSEIKFTYGVKETGMLGISCKYLSQKNQENKFNVYHPIKNISIIKNKENDFGEILVKKGILTNYLTGDSGKIIKEKCRCGAKETLLVYGRINYDIVNCVGATFHINEVEKVFSLLKEYVEDYYLEISEIEKREKIFGSLTIKIVPTKKLIDLENGNKFISEFIEKKLQLTKTRFLRDLINDSIFLPAQTELVSSLPSNNKKVRMRKITD